MSEPTYTITITESERTALAKALGTLTTKLLNAPIFVEAPNGGTQSKIDSIPRVTLRTQAERGRFLAVARAARAVLAPTNQPSPPAAAPAPIELRDRWARDRKGRELPFPEGVVTREITIWKTEQKTTKAKGNGNGADLASALVNLGYDKSKARRMAQSIPELQEGKPFLKVTWQSQERGYVDANCFDEKLCPWIITRMGQKTTLYLVKSGEYLNVVGVRA